MILTIDYDGTIIEDPLLFAEFINSALEKGHRVIIATMRYEHESATMDLPGMSYPVVNFTDPDQPVIRVEVIYTGRKAKIEYLKNTYSINPTIWMDNDPHWLFQDSI